MQNTCKFKLRTLVYYFIIVYISQTGSLKQYNRFAPLFNNLDKKPNKRGLFVPRDWRLLNRPPACGGRPIEWFFYLYKRCVVFKE